MLIGCHLSAADGFRGLARDALFVGANVFQFFTRNPRGGAAKPIDPSDVADYLSTSREHAFGPILAHAPYTLNPCSAKPETREFARDVFADDLSRMEHVPGNLYNFHPGSHVGQGVEAGIAQIVETLDAVPQDSPYRGRADELAAMVEPLVPIDPDYVPQESLYSEFLGR